MDFNGIRRLYLPLRPRAKFSPGRKTPPGVPAPSTGLRPLNVSRVKCGDGPCRGHSALPYAGNTVCLPCAFLKNCGRFDTGLPETRSGATGPSPFKVRDNQRPERSMSGAAKTEKRSPVPDFRHTLLWRPDIRTNGESSISIPFTTSDLKSHSWIFGGDHFLVKNSYVLAFGIIENGRSWLFSAKWGFCGH